MAERLRLGVLGASWIADRALIPAMQAAEHADATAIASREPERARLMARRHGVPRVHESYEALLSDPEIDAVYVGLVNSEHARWCTRALEAGKHVLCDKPLATSGEEARAMRASAESFGLMLMEGFQYRFHPRMHQLRETVREVSFAHAAFSFRLTDSTTYRLHPELGGGALLDVGCYTLDVLRWFLGEPDSVRSVMHVVGVDMTVAAALRFGGEVRATIAASFEQPDHQELVLLAGGERHRVVQPFTAWRDPHDPYAIMVDAFARSVLDGSPSPRSLDDSVATADLVDQVRAAARMLR
ncbi:MAG TPA: Gfo/Idh/MocA family oxidoreductase [Candidatus Dormibacteraeota bacterium]|nr:Gfo/Idh/MocA family oxidoreductase [Candidatus Dormibacteraeota bacterium]